MATGKKNIPDFFKEDGVDPVESATGFRQRVPEDKNISSAGTETRTGTAAKKKAGFYLSVQLLDRFNLKFHELKVAGVAIENKSTLLEQALSFALDDLDKGQESLVLQQLGG
jgi:hypothetical protein